MKKMTTSKIIDSLLQNWGTVICVLGAFTLLATGFALWKPVTAEVVAETPAENVNFATERPVFEHSYVNVFRQAAIEAVNNQVNPWTYLEKNWKPDVKASLITFIQKDAGQRIPENTVSVNLTLRSYSDPNSIIMEYRNSDGIIVTGKGNDPEPALYATFSDSTGEQKTYKLICANGLVQELGTYVHASPYAYEYVVKAGDCVTSITGMSPEEALLLAEKDDLTVRCIFTDPENPTKERSGFGKSRAFIYDTYLQNPGSIFDVMIQPGNIVRNNNGVWEIVAEKLEAKAASASTEASPSQESNRH